MLHTTISVEQLGPNVVYVQHGMHAGVDVTALVDAHRRQEFDEERPGFSRGNRVVSCHRHNDRVIRISTDHFFTESWNGFMTHVDLSTHAEFDDILAEWRNAR